MQNGFPGGSVVKNMPANAGDVGSISGSGRFPGEGNGNPLQYSCLGNPKNRGAWQAIVDGVTKSWTELSEHKEVRCIRHRTNCFTYSLICPLQQQPSKLSIIIFILIYRHIN